MSETDASGTFDRAAIREAWLRWAQEDPEAFKRALLKLATDVIIDHPDFGKVIGEGA